MIKLACYLSSIFIYLSFVRKKQAKVQRELEDAAKESRAVSPESTFGERSDLGANPFFASNVPSKAISKFVS